jgi:hypothetical protein
MPTGVWKTENQRPGDALRGMAYIEALSVPEPNSGCWLWLGPIDPNGYGRISKSTFGFMLAHRYAKHVDGNDVEGICVLHRCDNPMCVNPAHMFLGTKKQNSQDMVRKGRARGRFSKAPVRRIPR